MVITAIEEQKKHKERLSVFVDGKFLFGAHIDVVLDFGLKKGVELVESRIKEIKTADAFRTAYDKAVGFLANRPRSTQEIRQYLRDKLIYHHPEYAELQDSDDKAAFTEQQAESIDKIIDRLTEQGYVNDVDFAKWWISNRQQFKPRGKRLLLLELKTKGISNADIELALITPAESGHFSGEATEEGGYSEFEGALKVATKYSQRYMVLSDNEFKQKVGRYLASKGFDWDIIEKVIDRLRYSGV